MVFIWFILILVPENAPKTHQLYCTKPFIVQMNPKIQHYLTHNQNTNNFQIQNINKETSVLFIDTHAPKSSFGLDGVPTKLSKTIKVKLIKPLI